MLPVPEQYHLSPCEIKTLSNDPITTGYINQIADDCLEIYNKPEKLPIIHCNTTVKISIFNNSLGFRVLIGTVYLSTPEFIKIVELQSAANFEKRNFFRIKVKIDAQAYLVHESVQTDAPLEFFNVHIDDMSLSGLHLTTEQPLEVDSHLVVNLNIYNNNMALLCKIRRTINSDNLVDGYGCEFIDNSGRQFDLLCKYIFDCQREQIQIMKQMK